MSQHEFRAGVARRDISPDGWSHLTPTGMQRLSPSRGILDPLYVEALAIEAGGTLAFVVTADLRVISPAWAKQIREAVAQKTGCGPLRVLMSANHNHCSSPEVPSDKLLAMLPGSLEENRQKANDALAAANGKILGAMVEACVVARDDLRPAEIAATHAHILEPMAENRRMRLGSGIVVQCWGAGAPVPPGEKLVAPADTFNPVVDVLCVREVGALEPFAILTSYDAHIHLYELPGFSGEIAGAAKRAIERRIPEVVAMYASGTPGDIDIHCTHPIPPGGEAAEVEWFQECAWDLGERFAKAVVTVAAGTEEYIRPQAIKHAYFSIGEAGESPPRRVTVLNTLLLDDVALVTMPGEMFVAYGLELRSRNPARHLFLLGYNGSDSWYTPTLLGYEQGSYEAMRGPAKTIADEMTLDDKGQPTPARKARPESGAEIVNQIIGMLESLTKA
jgi:hypothetical protein